MTVKFFRSRTLSIIIAILTLLMFVFTAVLSSLLVVSTDIFRTPYMILEGEYSVDGGAWKAFDPDTPIQDRFHRIVFRGNIPKSTFRFYQEISISVRNLWFSLRLADGETLLESKYYTVDEFLDSYFEGMEVDESERDRMKRTILRLAPFEYYMPDTPGYTENFIFIEDDLTANGIDSSVMLEMEFINPYDIMPSGFSDLVKFNISHGNGNLPQFNRDVLPLCFIFLIICMFGLLFFPMAAFIFGKIDFRYLAFGFMVFFWGLFMIVQVTNVYIAHLIHDRTVCLFVDRISVYLFVTALLIFFCSNLTGPVTRVISGSITSVFAAAVMLSAVLHFTGVADMVVTGVYIHILIAINAAVMTALIISEVRNAGKEESRRMIFLLVSWIPMVITLILDVIDQIVSIPGINYFKYGLMVAVIAQIVRLIFDMRKQYRDAIRYQKMQRELYEAKVAVMTSQIRPHFMYNALTSIAMMCTIDPAVAQEATVTFAKYLRENMDSLKQKAPVPFTRELDHLKKYLYIEKLRFADKLNIVYDIQATDFVIPQLSVQPLVENAVKHGVGAKKKGGTVTITSRETDTAYEVVIADDGVGFDTSAPKADDGRSHIGMDNTRTRLKEMCGGYLVIESTVGEGTTAKIVLPKDKQNMEETSS